MATITGIKKEKVFEVIRRYKMAVQFDVLQFGDIFSIQINGKEVIGLTEEDILYLHNKYRQAYKKLCVDDLEERIRELEDELILKDDEYIDLEELYDKVCLDNTEIRNKMFFLGGELAGANEEIRLLQEDKIALLNDNDRLTKELFKLKQEMQNLHKENWRMLQNGNCTIYITNSNFRNNNCGICKYSDVVIRRKKLK